MERCRDQLKPLLLLFGTLKFIQGHSTSRSVTRGSHAPSAVPPLPDSWLPSHCLPSPPDSVCPSGPDQMPCLWSQWQYLSPGVNGNWWHSSLKLSQRSCTCEVVCTRLIHTRKWKQAFRTWCVHLGICQLIHSSYMLWETMHQGLKEEDCIHVCPSHWNNSNSPFMRATHLCWPCVWSWNPAQRAQRVPWHS